MYSRVLLAYDGTREGRTALREGAVLAKRCGSAVFLLCVIPEATARTPVGDISVGATHELFQGLFDEAMRWMGEAGFDVTGRITVGEPAQQIAFYARDFGAEVVVVGHRKKGFLERWWSGATGAYLLDHLPCSLLIARNEIGDDAFRAAMAPGA